MARHQCRVQVYSLVLPEKNVSASRKGTNLENATNWQKFHITLSGNRIISTNVQNVHSTTGPVNSSLLSFTYTALFVILTNRSALLMADCTACIRDVSALRF